MRPTIRPLIFASGLISLFAWLGAEPKPLVRILEENDIRNNSFNKKKIAVHFETQRGNRYLVSVNGKDLPRQNVRLSSENEVNVYKIGGLEAYLQDGSNGVEISVRNHWGDVKKEVDIDIGSVQKSIKGVVFNMCKRAAQDFEQHPERYERIAADIKALNEFVPEEYAIKTVEIPYLGVCICSDVIEKGGTKRAWFSGQTISLGYGMVNFKDFQEVKKRVYHEFGHGAYESLTKKEQTDFEKLHALIEKTDAELFLLFKDGEYGSYKAGGHPQDEASELFASAFMIRLNYDKKFEKRLQQYPEESQDLARKVMAYVEEIVVF